MCYLLHFQKAKSTGSHPTPASPRSDEAAPSNVSSRPQKNWMNLFAKSLETFVIFLVWGGVIKYDYGLNSGTSRCSMIFMVFFGYCEKSIPCFFRLKCQVEVVHFSCLLFHLLVS